MALQVVRDADAIILGAPGRQGGMCGEMRLFLDSLAPLQVERKGNAAGAMKVALPGMTGLCSARRIAPYGAWRLQTGSTAFRCS